MLKVKWAAARIVFLTAAFGAAGSCGVLGYLLGPLYSWYFFQDLNFFKYHRRFLPLAAAYWKLILEWLQNPEYRNMFTIPLTAPPMKGPDLSRVRIRSSWPQSDGNCNGCAECCTRRFCPLLDLDGMRCLGYGSFFWRYFNCGRYPENTAQIRFYDCRKWEVVDQSHNERRSGRMA